MQVEIGVAFSEYLPYKSAPYVSCCSDDEDVLDHGASLAESYVVLRMALILWIRRQPRQDSNLGPRLQRAE